MEKEVKDLLGKIGVADKQGLTIVGIRMSNKANKFDDYVGVRWLTKDTDVFRLYPATTKPGLHWLLKPMNKRGTACMVIGFYRSLWRIGKHQGKYDALTQISPITLWMDGDKDGELEYTNKVSFSVPVGINLHKASDNWLSVKREQLLNLSVGAWSAGCQVIASAKHFNMLMWFVKQSGQGLFDYVLVDNTRQQLFKTITLADNGDTQSITL